MEWDLGIAGFALLVAMSVGFGVGAPAPDMGCAARLRIPMGLADWRRRLFRRRTVHQRGVVWVGDGRGPAA